MANGECALGYRVQRLEDLQIVENKMGLVLSSIDNHTSAMLGVLQVQWSRGRLTVGSCGPGPGHAGRHGRRRFREPWCSARSTRVFGAKAKTEAGTGQRQSAETSAGPGGIHGWRRAPGLVVPGRTMGRLVARRAGHGGFRRRVHMGAVGRLYALRDQLSREGEVRRPSASGEGCLRWAMVTPNDMDDVGNGRQHIGKHRRA